MVLRVRYTSRENLDVLLGNAIVQADNVGTEGTSPEARTLELIGYLFQAKALASGNSSLSFDYRSRGAGILRIAIRNASHRKETGDGGLHEIKNDAQRALELLNKYVF